MRTTLRVIFIVLLFFFQNGILYSATNACFKCHNKKNIIPGKYIHNPLKKGDCLRCHCPHVSKYKRLLKEEPSDLCFSCHKTFKKKISTAIFIHRPVRERACLRCHLPHASKYKNLLKKNVKNTCFECHKSLLKEKKKFYHEPYADGKCLSCHNPHCGNDTRFLQDKNTDKICLRCHKKDKKFLRSHFNNKNIKHCLSCHSPHFSNNKNLLRPVTHKPFAQRQCAICHNSNKKGINLCLQCHKDELKSFAFYHNHLLGGYSKNSCIVCHNPHVGDTKALLIDSPERLCSSCHPQAYIQKRHSIYIHPHRKNCLECHRGHGSNHPAMLNGDGNQVCVRCHKTQGRFTHPVGEKVLDPRNGQSVTCITCHEPMGTDFKYELKLSGEAALCLECHKNY